MAPGDKNPKKKVEPEHIPAHTCGFMCPKSCPTFLRENCPGDLFCSGVPPTSDRDREKNNAAKGNDGEVDEEMTRRKKERDMEIYKQHPPKEVDKVPVPVSIPLNLPNNLQLSGMSSKATEKGVDINFHCTKTTTSKDCSRPYCTLTEKQVRQAVAAAFRPYEQAIKYANKYYPPPCTDECQKPKPPCKRKKKSVSKRCSPKKRKSPCHKKK